MVWWWVVQLVVAVALSVASTMLVSKPKTTKPAAATQADNPTSEAGRPWPVIFGSPLITETNVLRVLENGVYEYDNKISKKEKQHVVEYSASIHLGACLEADALTEIVIDDKSAWTGNLETMQSVYLDLPEFFGGDDKEGGLRGEFFNLIGRDDQVMPPTLCQRWGETSEDTPAYRKRSSVFFAGVSPGQGFLWRKNSPVLAQKVGLRYRRSSKGPMADETRMIGIHSNPAHMIYECMINSEWGMGDSPSAFNLTTWNAAAQQLFDEGFGLTMAWMRQSTVEDFINEIQDHIQANVFLDPTTGLWEIDLMRGDYDVDTLDRLNVDNATLSGFNRALWGELVNEVVVSYTNAATGKPESTTGYSLASILNQGKISTSRDYHGIADPDLASRVADRDVRTSSAPLATLQAALDRRSWTVRPGKLFVVDWPSKKLFGVVCRAMDVDYGDHLDSTIRVKLMQDVFSLEKPTPKGSQPPVDPDPSTDPEPMAATEVFTLPAYFVSSSDLQPQPLDLVYPQTVVGVLAFQGDSAVYPYQLYAANVDSTGVTTYANEGAKTTVERIVLPVALAAEITSDFPDAWVARKSRGPQIGGYMFFGSGSDAEMEIVQVIDYDEGTDEWSLTRGVMDTIPRAWPAGTPAWFVNPGVRILDDLVDRSGGDTVNFKLLSRTTRGVLPLADAPLVTDTASLRPWLPLRPAQVVVNGSYFGPVAVGAGPNIRVTWSTRNRVFEDGLILRWDETSVAPEYTQGTVISIYDQGGVLRYRREGLWTETLLDLPAVWFARYTSITVKVTSKRHDLGLESLQGQSIVVTGLPGNPAADPPPAPPALTTPPATEPAPGAGVWLLQGYAFSVAAGANVPAIMVSGKRDRPDAIGLNIRYRKVSSTDWFNDRETTLSDAPVIVPNTTIATKTDYEVEVSYRLSSNLPTLWRSLGTVLTGALTADDTASVGGRDPTLLLTQVDAANTKATAAQATADAASTALFDPSNGALTRLTRLSAKGSAGALNPNGDYRDWAGSLLLPYRYELWQGATGAFNRTTGLYGDAVDVTAPANTDVGFIIRDGNLPLPSAAFTKLTLEGDIELVSGSFDGSGVYIVADSGPPSYGSVSSLFIPFKTLFGAGVPGRIYRLSTAVQSLPFVAGQTRYYMIMMNHWSGAGAGGGPITSANRIRWHRCETFQATNLEANYTNDIAVLTAADVSAAGRISVAEAKLTTRPNLCPNGGAENGITGLVPTNCTLSAPGGIWVSPIRALPTTGTVCYYDFPSFAVVADDIYTISADLLHLVTDGAGAAYVQIIFLKADGSLDKAGAGSPRSGTFGFSVDDTTRKIVAVSDTSGSASVTGFARVVFTYTSPAAVTALGARFVKVERGPLPYTPYTAEAQAVSTTARVTQNEIAQGNTAAAVAGLTQSVGASLQQTSFLNANARFGAYSASPGYPDGWSTWIGAASRFSKQNGQGANNAVHATPAAGEDLGFLQPFYVTPGQYLLTLEGSLSSGTWAGAGMYVDAGSGAAINCSTDPDSAGVTGVSGPGVRRWSKIITIAAAANAQVYAMYGFAAGFGAVAAKTLDIFVCGIEPLDAGGKVALNAQADASTALYALTNPAGSFAVYQNTTNARFTAPTGEVQVAKSQAISTSSAYADGAIATYNNSVSTSAGGLAATAQQAFTTSVSTAGVVAAGIGLRVSAGLITGYVGLTAGGGGSAFDIDVNFFRVWNGASADPVFSVVGGVTYIADLRVRNESIIPGAVTVPVTAKNLTGGQLFANGDTMLSVSFSAKAGQTVQLDFSAIVAYPSTRITITYQLNGTRAGGTTGNITNWSQSFDGQDQTPFAITWAEPIIFTGTNTFFFWIQGSRTVSGHIDCTFGQLILKATLQKA